MIRVIAQNEPVSFARAVRAPGRAWLVARHCDFAKPLPKDTDPPPYWRRCLPELHALYQGICAYLAVYIERAAGGVSVDHYVAKSALAGQTYEWANYRLACTMMNARKCAFDDVLDPFALPGDMAVFHLELVSGRIFVNPAVAEPLASQAESTRVRLKLDNGVNRELRARHFQDYLSGHVSKAFLERNSPFVHAEAVRQGL